MVIVLRQVAGVFKPRIGAAITLCALAGMAITPGVFLPGWKILVLALVVFVSSAASGAFNQYAERELDARMPRTRNRPFVTGELPVSWMWPAGIGLLLAVSVGCAALVLNVYVALYVFLGAFVYGVIYTVWLKQYSAWNIVIGGLAGSFAVLAGSAAISPGLAPTSVILAIVLFLWTPPHFWSLATYLHEEYSLAGVPMLPVVVGVPRAARIILAHTIVLVAVSLTPIAFGMGLVYLAGAIIGGSIFLKCSIALARNPSPRTAMANFVASLMQLGILLIATISDGYFI